MAEARCWLSNTVGVGCGIVALLARFLYVDSSHSGLITANSKRTSWCSVNPGGCNYKEKEVQSRLMASAPFDWSLVGKTLAGSFFEGGRDSQLPSSALISPSSHKEPGRGGWTVCVSNDALLLKK